MHKEVESDRYKIMGREKMACN